MPNSYGVTDMVWQWGQFLDHDLSLTPAAEQESLPIPIPQRDPAFNPFISGVTMPFGRSAFDPSSGVTLDRPRTPINTITAFIDASNVYGSDPGRTRALRTNDGTGRLRTSHDGRLLRYNDDFLPNDDGNRGRTTALFLAGDIRANEHVGLTSMHALFVREHNRLAGIIASENPSLMGQEIFELARKIVGALMQAITYNEFLPLLLGPGALGPYEGYDPRVDPSISNEFSTAAYRFGHTMLSPSLMHIDASGRTQAFSLAASFFNPELVEAEGIEGFLRGLAIQQAQEIDPLLIDEVRNMLFGAPGGPVRDLAALNIQRTRDHGLADYNTTRMAYGLPPVRDFADVSSDPDTVEALRAVYGEIGYLDLWVGGLAEDHLPGALVGETFHAILVDQFRRLRDGDRYWYERDPFFRREPRPALRAPRDDPRGRDPPQHPDRGRAARPGLRRPAARREAGRRLHPRRHLPRLQPRCVRGRDGGRPRSLRSKRWHHGALRPAGRPLHPVPPRRPRDREPGVRDAVRRGRRATDATAGQEPRSPRGRGGRRRVGRGAWPSPLSPGAWRGALRRSARGRAASPATRGGPACPAGSRAQLRQSRPRARRVARRRARSRRGT